jgi:hypothetical protein
VNRRITGLVVSLFSLPVLAQSTTSTARQSATPFTVHEWGTFTSVAGEDGQAVAWQPLAGPQDLPCFVERSTVNIKPLTVGTVRMETPVLYFYARQPLTARVDVVFKQGAMTEWYPQAIVPAVSADIRNPAYRGTISWPEVHIRPGVAETFRTEAGHSHYYAARATDASPIEVNGQPEKFLFYRGAAGFQPPLTAVLGTDGRVRVANPAGQPLGDLILFQNRGGVISYETARFDTATGTLAPLSNQGESAPPLAELEHTLVTSGLLPKEAEAMLATWRDSWFDEGTRVFYVAPRRFVDDVLALNITPAPHATARVFVGRIEIITPDDVRQVKAALGRSDQQTLVKFGRFLQPIADRIVAESPAAAKPPVYDQLTPFYATLLTSPTCQER